MIGSDGVRVRSIDRRVRDDDDGDEKKGRPSRASRNDVSSRVASSSTSGIPAESPNRRRSIDGRGARKSVEGVRRGLFGDVGLVRVSRDW